MCLLSSFSRVAPRYLPADLGCDGRCEELAVASSCMGIEEFVGDKYGPYPVRVAAEQVAAYVSVTGDDSGRWVKYAPPSFAGALLFAAAPDFLGDPGVVPYTRRLVHGDQSFTWHRPVELDESLVVEGRFARARERSGVIFATFTASVLSGTEPVIDSVSTFLMGEVAPSDVPVEQPEREVAVRGEYSSLPAGLQTRPPRLLRSASRLDLVRYAAASGDFNPVHFDHQSAVDSGFPGVLVHGLLMGSWLLQSVAALSSRPDPLASAKLRFRNPLRPGVTAVVESVMEDSSDGTRVARSTLTAGEVELVSARIRLKRT